MKVKMKFFYLMKVKMKFTKQNFICFVVECMIIRGDKKNVL
jgi:hypothetical protein